MLNITDDELDKIIRAINELYSYDFAHYNRNTLKRRICIHSIRKSINNFEEYYNNLIEDKAFFDEVFSFFSINVTEFFREPEQLKIFRTKLVPYLKSYPHIKIWCAGSSKGESPYTLAIILYEEDILHKAQIYATDFNNRVLQLAKEALFEIKDFKKIQNNYKISGGINNFQDYLIKKVKYYKIKKMVREKVLFFNHNLATDWVINEFELIICKNVIIYFDEVLKNKVFNLFYTSLKTNGFLIIGQSESIPKDYENRFKLFVKNSKIYQKVG